MTLKRVLVKSNQGAVAGSPWQREGSYRENGEPPGGPGLSDLMPSPPGQQKTIWEPISGLLGEQHEEAPHLKSWSSKRRMLRNPQAPGQQLGQ